jgi:tungstate transport system permease protein
MGDLGTAFSTAIHLIFHLNSDLLEIIVLSLQVNLVALVPGCLIALPLGAALAVLRFRGRAFAVALVNAAMGIPGVVVGLVVYLLLSRSGPLGFWGLLFTPTAMVIAQLIMVTPIIAAFAYQTVADLHEKYDEQLRSFCAGHLRAMTTLLWDGRFSLVTGILAGFGRAMGEIGTVIVVGGNIAHSTRVMTTAIELETSKGDLPLAVALGIVLVVLSLIITLAAEGVRHFGNRRYA